MGTRRTGTPSERREAQRAASATSALPPGGAAAQMIAALQRTAGNRAVSRLLAAGAAPRRAIQRAVGFEFEDPSWTVLQLQPGRTFRNPSYWSASGWLTSGNVAPGDQKAKGASEHTGENVFARPGGNHINSTVGPFNLQTAPKKGTLHRGAHFQVEPDGPYNEHGVTNRMDLEFVTEPFPETPAGLSQLGDALADMQAVYKRISSGAVGEWTGGPMAYEGFVTPSDHGFADASIYLYGGAPGGDFKPQVTGGFNLADVPEVMETLGAPAASEWQLSDREVAQRERMRAMLYGANTANRREAKVLASGPVLAEAVLRRLVTDGILARDDKGVDALKGFLALALMYIVALSANSPEGIKIQLPLMSRYSFGTLFSQIPKDARDPLLRREGKVSLMAGMSAAIRGESALRSRVKDMSGPMIAVGTIYGGGEGVAMGYGPPVTALMNALGSFSRAQWLENVMAGKDLLTAGDLLEHLKRGEATEEQRKVATDYDKSIAVYLRGHGATKSVRDVPGEERGGLALVENRAIAPKVAGDPSMTKRERMSIAEAHLYALQYFEWVLSIKERREAAREREHAQSKRLTEDSSKARSMNLWG